MQDKCPFCNTVNEGEKDELIRCPRCNRRFKVGNIEMRKQIAKQKKALAEKKRLEKEKELLGATKSCPFCAETIKSLAIKCKYCDSDLKEPEIKEPEIKKIKPKIRLVPNKKTIVKSYIGKVSVATRKFQKDAEKFADKGYQVESQLYTQGTWGCGSFLGAIILCFLLIGIIVFIYMLLVKPAGELTVTYKWKG